MGNSLNAFCVVTSRTSSTEIPFTWAMNSAAMERLQGSFRVSFSGPSAGESVSKQRELRGSCFTSFCFLEKKESTFKTGGGGRALTYMWMSLVLGNTNIHLYRQSLLDSYQVFTSPLLRPHNHFKVGILPNIAKSTQSFQGTKCNQVNVGTAP